MTPAVCQSEFGGDSIIPYTAEGLRSDDSFSVIQAKRTALFLYPYLNLRLVSPPQLAH